MSELSMSRRGFLKTSAATAAIAATAGAVSMGTWSETQAVANEMYEGVTVATSTCNACSSKCGMKVYSKEGRLWKVKGHELHPNAKGKLCARGHGYATIAYTDGRITEPLKRVGDQEFEPISWDQAYQEIGDKVKEILAESGPNAVAIVNDPRPSGEFYCKRFINALGSKNYYTHNVACNISNRSAYDITVGGNSSVDWGNAKCVMFIGRSYGDGVRPSSAENIANAAERGAEIIMVDPRYNATAHIASDWVAIRPGTDLALLLAIANVLVKDDLYDKEFVETMTEGFDEFADAIKDYTPKWAEEITTIDADRIEGIAHTMAKHAPASSVEVSWRAAIGCSYDNSLETSRMLTYVNALLGCYGKPGGQKFGDSPKLGGLEGPKFKKLPEMGDDIIQYGSDVWPLAKKGYGVAHYLGDGAVKGDIRAVFFYNSNALMGYAHYESLRDRLAELDLMVAIDIQMSETAINSDYILPDVTYIERYEVPAVNGAVIDARQPGIAKVHMNTRPVDEIFPQLAEACGIGEYFTFTVHDAIDSQLAPFEEAEKIKEEGMAKIESVDFASKGDFKFKTEDGKIHFADDVWKKAGLDRNIQWIPPKRNPDLDNPNEFRLIGGKQAIHTHTSTTNVPLLIQITKDYGLERVWMNAARAEALGIEDGDMIEISSELNTNQVRVHVTERLHPDCIFNPTHYGVKSPYLKAGQGLGMASMDHTPFDYSQYDGSTMSQEAIVSVKKVEA